MRKLNNPHEEALSAFLHGLIALLVVAVFVVFYLHFAFPRQPVISDRSIEYEAQHWSDADNERWLDDVLREKPAE